MNEKLLKTLVKNLLKVFVPVVGSLAVDVATDVATSAIEARTKKRADDLVGRLTVRIAADLDALASEVGRPSFNPDAVLATVADLLGDQVRVERAWAEAGFDGAKAAAAVVASGGSVLAGLSDAEARFCAQAVAAAFRALDGERAALDATEVEFRRAVLSRLDGIASPATPADDRLREGLASAVLGLPTRPFIKEISAPGALLRPDIDRAVPFHGREAELQELLTWSTAGAPLCVRLVTGAGGMGKTRLLFEACRRLRLRGWRAGMLDTMAMPGRQGLWPLLGGAGSGLFVVIDYAENRREQIADVIAAALGALAAGPPPVRIVLLARAADDWWEELRGERGGVGEVIAGPACDRIALRPLAAGIDDRRRSYGIAARHFSAVLGRPVADAPEPDLVDRAYDRALLLHMSALSAVEGVPVKGDQGILDHALDRERRFWRERASAMGLDTAYERAVLQGMAAVTLSGGAVNRADATRILRGIPLLADAPAVLLDAVAQLLHDVYAGERWIDPVLPDLLGEHLVQVALDGDGGALLDIVLGEKAP